MYCRNCGNFVADGDNFCTVCGAKQKDTTVQEPQIQSSSAEPFTEFQAENRQNAQQPIHNDNNAYQQPAHVYVQPAPKTSRTLGLGKAITSTALSIAAYIMFVIGMIFVGELSLYEVVYLDLFINSLTFLLFAIGLAIPSLVLGIQSVKLFNQEKNAGRKKPIPTLIVGLIGLADGAAILLGAGSFVLLLLPLISLL